MKNIFSSISIFVMMLLAFAGCDVHEFPEERSEKVPFLLHLNFDTELPLYKEVVVTKGGAQHHDIRYIINAYRTDNVRGENRVADTTFVFTKSEISNLNYTAQLELPEGTYNFKVWADYVDAGSTADKYYDTRDFSEIVLADRENHPGSNDYRDAFRGYATASVINPAYYAGNALNDIDNQATVEMKRPLGKFKFVSTDVDIFISRVTELLKEKGKLDAASGTENADESPMKNIDLNDFFVEFTYYFMPCSFNMFTDKSASSWPGMTFTGKLYAENESELTLGFDYIFVNETGTTLQISAAVYTRDGEKLSQTEPIEVPIARSKLTIVRGEFLTSQATGGVSINPGYDGDDYNHPI